MPFLGLIVTFGKNGVLVAKVVKFELGDVGAALVLRMFGEGS